MKKIAFAFAALLLSTFSFAQIEGKWKTIDDETGKAKSIVEIFKKADGKYYGKVVQLLTKPDIDKCENCKDDRKNKPILGLEVIRGMVKDGNGLTGGTIVDPKNGKVYKCNITPKGDKLEVRAYIGFAAIGRSQTWLKTK